MKMKGKDLEFISWIKRDGKGTEKVPQKLIDLERDNYFELYGLSMTEGTYLARNDGNWFVVKFNTLEVNGGEIEDGDTILWNYMYWDEGSSEDFFGTPPEESWHVVEAYIESVESKVFTYMGALCVEKGSQIISLKEIKETMPQKLEDFAVMNEGRELDIFLEEGVFEDKEATLDEAKEELTKIYKLNGTK